jgi:cbb3-type cytochrome oxidase cytochrome c subunit
MRFNEMFCVTCHALAVDRGGETTLIGGDIGPELTKVGSKVRPEWLIAWLRSPQAYLQHTRMPQYQWSNKDLSQVTQYILDRLTDPDLLKDVPALGTPTETEVERGRVLFVKKGCAECHVIEGVVPQSDFGPDLSSEGMSSGPYSVEVKAARKLSVALHFVRNSEDRLQVAQSVVPRSMIAFIQAKITNPSSTTPEAHMPQFQMSQSDLDDVTTALLSMTGPPLSSQAGEQLAVPSRKLDTHPGGPVAPLLDRYRCYTCHAFNGYGGTLAPDLSYEGSRSRREWLSSFLKSPQTLRPTLTVRMPRFNMPEQDAAAIAEYLSGSLRHVSVNPTAIDESKFTQQMAAHGKDLFEVKYACQSCHTIGSSGGYVGPSLNNVGNWMTPAWIQAWLSNPQSLVPGVIEPRHSFATGEIQDITAYLLTLKQAPSASPVPDVARGGQQ